MNKIYGILGIATKAGKVISGFDSIEDSVKRNKVNLIIIANDASDKTKKEIRFICDKYKVQSIVFGNIEENSHAIGKKNRAIIGICDVGFTNKFLELIDDINKNT